MDEHVVLTDSSHTAKTMTTLLIWDPVPRISDISEASPELLLAPGSLLIGLILSTGKGSDATEARPALDSDVLLQCSPLLAALQI